MNTKLLLLSARVSVRTEKKKALLYLFLEIIFTGVLSLKILTRLAS